MYYLLLKTHNKTGLKYLCQTKRKDPIKYPGSGTRWLRHLNKHGFDLTTKILGKFSNSDNSIDVLIVQPNIDPYFDKFNKDYQKQINDFIGKDNSQKLHL